MGKKFSHESHFLFGNLHHNELDGFVKSPSRALNGDKLTFVPRTEWNKPNPLAELEIISFLFLFARRVCWPRSYKCPGLSTVPCSRALLQFIYTKFRLTSRSKVTR